MRRTDRETQFLASNVLTALNGHQMPAHRTIYMCGFCNGPTIAGRPWCVGCQRLTSNGAPKRVCRAIVPLTTAFRPSRWYEVLRSYKAAHQEYGWLLGSVLAMGFVARAPVMRALLGGEPTLVAVVPSKRRRTPQQLLQVARLVLPHVADALSFAGGVLPRHEYRPAVFHTHRVANHRIVLVDDLWVSGATITSAAGALLRDGAKSVVLMPIARHVALQYYAGHPYMQRFREQ